LAAAGAVAGLVVAVDQYLFKNKLADVLLLPVSVPTGFLALVVAAASFGVLLVSRREAPLRARVVDLERQLDTFAILASALQRRASSGAYRPRGR
jgi:hypothetical protein